LGAAAQKEEQVENCVANAFRFHLLVVVHEMPDKHKVGDVAKQLAALLVHKL